MSLGGCGNIITGCTECFGEFRFCKGVHYVQPLNTFLICFLGCLPSKQVGSYIHGRYQGQGHVHLSHECGEHFAILLEHIGIYRATGSKLMIGSVADRKGLGEVFLFSWVVSHD